MSRQLFLSPHLDDVVLSCGGTILKAKADGHDVAVATVMSHGDERGLHPRRRDEDLAALALLGIEPLWLGLADAPWRSPFYRSFTAIVLEEDAADRAFATTVTAQLEHLVRTHRSDRVFLPLAVGTHIDHRIVHESWRALRGLTPITFYEDRPYAFLTPSVALRLRELGGDGDDDLRPLPSQIHELLANVRDAPHLRAYLPAGRERFRAARALVRRVWAPREATALHLTPETHAYGDEVATRVEAAILCYESQVADLFGDADGLRLGYRRYARRLATTATHAERLWRLDSE